jgi:hypothetical protein
MCEDVLKSVRKLEGIHVAQTELDVGVDDEFGKAKDFSTKMERISES